MSFFKQALAIIRSLFGSNSARVNTVVAKLPGSPSSSTMAEQKELVPAFASFPTTQPAMRIKVLRFIQNENDRLTSYRSASASSTCVATSKLDRLLWPSDVPSATDFNNRSC